MTCATPSSLTAIRPGSPDHGSIGSPAPVRLARRDSALMKADTLHVGSADRGLEPSRLHGGPRRAARRVVGLAVVGPRLVRARRQPVRVAIVAVRRIAALVPHEVDRRA